MRLFSRSYNHVLFGCLFGLFGDTQTSYAEENAIHLDDESEALSEEPWWIQSGDVNLISLVERALKENENLQALAQTRQAVLEASAAASGQLFPQLSIGGTASISPTQSLGFQFGGIRASGSSNAAQQEEIPAVVGNGSVALQGQWAIDYAGRTTATSNALKAQSKSLGAQTQAQRVEVARLVTSLYLDHILGASQVQLLDDQLAENEKLLAILEVRFKDGQATAADVLRQRESIAVLRAQKPLIEAAQIGRRKQLALLSNQEAETIRFTDDYPVRLHARALSEPLLHSIPELQRLEQLFEQSRFELKSAKRSRLPQLSLSGQIGYQGFYFNELNSQDFWGAGLNLSIPLFTGGTLSSTVRQRRLQAEARKLEYEFGKRQVKTNYDVELERIRALSVQGEAIAEQITTSDQSFQAALSAYREGIGDFSAVILSNLNRFSAQNAALQNTRSILESQLNLSIQGGGKWMKGVR